MDNSGPEDGRSVLLPLAIAVNTPPSSSSPASHHTWSEIPAPQTASPVYTRRDDASGGGEGGGEGSGEGGSSEWSDWLVAKMWVRTADVHYHILGSLVASRLLAETVSLTVYRTLPSVHPVRSTSPINQSINQSVDQSVDFKVA